jgi:hypothetical protein
MRKFLSDLFKEKADGKISSKKFWGNILMFFCAATFVMDGLHWYDVSKDLFNPTLIAGCTLIGLRTVGNMMKSEDK